MATKQGAVIEQPALQAAEEPNGNVPVVRESQPMGMSMFERMASDPTVDVAKLEKLMELHERVLDRNAKAAFNAAMSAAQKAMRPIAADSNNPQTKSRYASYFALDKALRPIYTEQGFALSFGTEVSPMADHVRVLCYASHADGHERIYHADMPNDGKGAKGGDVMTKTHATGAAMQYGMRYLLKLIFNVAIGEDDTDGNEPPAKRPSAPVGFADWLADLEATADNGEAALREAWSKSVPERRTYLTTHGNGKWDAIKTKAKAVKA